MADPPHWYDLGTLNREQAAAVAPYALLVLPVGATEQHGPHLPLATDYALVEAVLTRALAAASLPRPVVVAPMLPYGNSTHHLFACAGSVSATTLGLVLADLIGSFARSGFHRILILNGHGGNDSIARAAVSDAANVHKGIFAAASYWAFARPDAGGQALRFVPGHAGCFEASLLLAARPDLVCGDVVPDATPEEPGFLVDDWGGDVTVVRSGDWARSKGFSDSPGTATAALGHAHLEVITRGLARFLEKLAVAPLP